MQRCIWEANSSYSAYRQIINDLPLYLKGVEQGCVLNLWKDNLDLLLLWRDYQPLSRWRANLLCGLKSFGITTHLQLLLREAFSIPPAGMETTVRIEP
jgi:hypothetical protein